MRAGLLLQTNLTARTETAHRLHAIDLIARIHAIYFAVASEMLRNAQLVAFALELLGAALAKQLAISFVRFVADAAVKLSIAHTGLSYASPVIAAERMLAARNRCAQLDRFIAAIEAIGPAVAAPAGRNASTIVAFEFVRCTRTVRLIGAVAAVIVTVANVPIVDAKILIRTFEFGGSDARHIAAVFVAEIRTIVHAIASLGAGYAATVRASELRFGTIAHRAIRFVTFVHTIEVIIAIPSTGNAFAASAPVFCSTNRNESSVWGGRIIDALMTYLK